MYYYCSYYVSTNSQNSKWLYVVDSMIFFLYDIGTSSEIRGFIVVLYSILGAIPGIPY